MAKSYDFEISIRFRHEENNKTFRESTGKELLRLSKYHSHIINASLIVDCVNLSHTAEITLHVPGHTLHAEFTDYSLGKAFDQALEKIKIQLKKEHDKRLDHRTTPTVVAADDEISESDEDFTE